MKNFSCRNVYFVFQSTLTTKVISGLSNKKYRKSFFNEKDFSDAVNLTHLNFEAIFIWNEAFLI